MERGTLVRIVPTKIPRLLAIRINIKIAPKIRIARSIKAKTSYLLVILRSIKNRTSALDARSRGFVTAIVPRILKELHNRHTFYPIMTIKCQAYLNFYTLGEE